MPYAPLSVEEVKQIMVDIFRGEMFQREIAQKYFTTQSTVSRIQKYEHKWQALHNLTWPDGSTGSLDHSKRREARARSIQHTVSGRRAGGWSPGAPQSPTPTLDAILEANPEVRAIFEAARAEYEAAENQRRNEAAREAVRKLADAPPIPDRKEEEAPLQMPDIMPWEEVQTRAGEHCLLGACQTERDRLAAGATLLLIPQEMWLNKEVMARNFVLMRRHLEALNAGSTNHIGSEAQG